MNTIPLLWGGRNLLSCGKDCVIATYL
jgi:hypothetical protein